MRNHRILPNFQNILKHRYMKYFVTVIILTAMIIVSFSMESCTKNTNQVIEGGTSAKNTWTIIQDNILTPSCATSGCHASTSDANYVQHNLLLTSATAYDNLINIISKMRQQKQPAC